MKRYLLSIPGMLFCACLWAAGLNNETVTIVCEGTVIQAQQLENGHLNFFESIQYEYQLTGVYTTSTQTERVTVRRYYLGNSREVEEITQENYKAMIKKYLPNAPELHKRLGKFGFRFENVRYMVQFYNKFRA